MTVLESEEDTDKRSVPPRKKFCLSISNRERTFPSTIPQPPHTSSRGGLFDRPDFLYSTYLYLVLSYSIISILFSIMIFKILFVLSRYRQNDEWLPQSIE